MSRVISQQSLDELCANCPDWLRTQRYAAFQTFSSLPLPTRRDADWQHFEVRTLNLDKISLPLNGSRAITETLTPLPANLAKEGVIFCDIATALKKHGELIREYLGKSIAPDEPRKFAALHSAFWNAGAFLFVPRGVQISTPLEVTYQFCGENVAGFPRTLVVVEQGAEAALVQRFVSPSFDQSDQSVPPPQSPSLHSSATEVFIKESGRLHYISLQNFGESVFDFALKRAHILRDAKIDWVVGMFGAAFQRYDIECIMEGEGGTSFMYGVGVGGDRQQLGQFTRQHHSAGNTVSDLLFKNVLFDHAVSSYAGLIKVEKNANGVNAYQANRNLVLSERVKCNTRPILEIESNQLRCTHGATVGRLDENQIYYLRTRGISEPQARQLLIEAFLESVLARIQVESVYKEFVNLVHQKVVKGC